MAQIVLGAMQENLWQLEDHRAVAISSDLHASVDTLHPEAGLRTTFGRSAKQQCEMLRLLLADFPGGGRRECKEVYQRGCDLVATYQQLQAPKFRHQVYWRVLDRSEIPATFAFELIVSVQTELLDTHPEIFATSRFQSDELAVCAAGDDRFQKFDLTNNQPISQAISTKPQICLWRLADTIHSFAEIASPHDGVLQAIERTETGGVKTIESVWKLAAGRLEKGVILRSRHWGLLLPRSSDEEHALAWRDKLLQSPLPLTA